MPEIETSPHGAAPSLDALCENAMKLQVAGRLDLAEPIYRRILQTTPTHAAANHCLGMLLVHRRLVSEALPCLLAALRASPEVPDYWLGYLEALLLHGETHQAQEALALARRHGLAGAEVEEFTARLQVKASASTAAADAAAIKQQEDVIADLLKVRRFSEALPLAQHMTERFPAYGAGWKIYAALLWVTGRRDEGLAAMQTSTRLLPRDAEAISNYGAALNKVQRLDEAERWLLRAVEIDPDFAPAHAHLADSYQLQGRYTEAEQSFRRTIALLAANPGAPLDIPHSSLLFMLCHNPDISAADLFAEHCRVGAYLERNSPATRPRHANDKAPERRLRVGIVSSDLRNHAVASFIEPVLREWHHQSNIHITAYFAGPAEDEISLRLRTYVDDWRPVFDLSDVQLATAIRQDRIDILLDIAGHTSMHRLAAFAQKPAPVQASWLGYPCTTGLNAMDYYLVDRHFLPPGEFDRYYTEKLAYLPTVWTFDPDAAAPAVSSLPALTNGALTFGSFNRLGKINEATVRLWSQALQASPNARLLIAGIPLQRQHEQLRHWFELAGIDSARLAFHAWRGFEDLLALHHSVDICLDTTPYTGCTTSNHALWMGVPTLTLVGPTGPTRLCAANLGHLDLAQFVAATTQEFVAKSVYWAAHTAELAEIRAGMRERWRSAPARDSAVVSAGIERGLRHMWQRWCAGLPPQSFELKA
jgi:predicted O-linked N-acetylglucosamine transferase (SPINDLY family)